MDGSNKDCFWLLRGTTSERSWYKNNSYLDNNVIYYLPSHVVSSHNVDVLKADSGATKIYIKDIHKHNLTQYQTLQNGPKATLPDQTTIEAKGQGILQVHESLLIPALVYPQLASESLLSIGQLCNQGCVAVFRKEVLNIYKNNQKFCLAQEIIKMIYGMFHFLQTKLIPSSQGINQRQSSPNFYMVVPSHLAYLRFKGQ